MRNVCCRFKDLALSKNYGPKEKTKGAEEARLSLLNLEYNHFTIDNVV